MSLQVISMEDALSSGISSTTSDPPHSPQLGRAAIIELLRKNLSLSSELHFNANGKTNFVGEEAHEWPSLEGLLGLALGQRRQQRQRQQQQPTGQRRRHCRALPAEPGVARDRVRQQDAAEPDRAEGRIGAGGGDLQPQPDISAATATSILRRQQGRQIE